MTLQAMPIISQGLPAFTNDNNSGFSPARLANNTTYGDVWQSAANPSGGSPIWLAYDISGVSKTQVVLAWFADIVTNYYDYTVKSNSPYQLPANYTIDVNTGAGGGSPPGSSWTTLVTVTGNVLHSRQHVLNLTGKNWVRINLTANATTAPYTGVALNMDLHDASAGIQDSYLLLGDSITQLSLNNDPVAPGGTLAQIINQMRPSYFPVTEGGGIFGETSTEIASNLSRWLGTFPGKYISINIGTNDAGNAVGGFVATYQSNMTSIIAAILAAGCIPIIPTIPYSGNTPHITNVPLLNTVIRTLYANNPQVIVGPDLYSYFLAHQNLLDVDGLHPNAAGKGAYRWLWAGTLVQALYSPTAAYSRLMAHT